jgi:hypothetical protein
MTTDQLLIGDTVVITRRQFKPGIAPTARQSLPARTLRRALAAQERREAKAAAKARRREARAKGVL